MIASPRVVPRRLWPPAATTRYCRPHATYVIGVAWPPAGRSARRGVPIDLATHGRWKLSTFCVTTRSQRIYCWDMGMGIGGEVDMLGNGIDNISLTTK